MAGEDEDDIGLTNNGHPLRGHTVTVNAKIVEMEGPPGKLTCNFKHLVLDFELIEGGKKLKIDAWFGSRKTMAAIRTSISHIQDLITGVTKELPIKDAFGLCPLSYKRLHQPN